VAKDEDEARTHADAILGMDIYGPRKEGPFRVNEVWVEGASDIDKEYYASIILDRSEKKPLVILSRMGGMNIEEVAETDPDALVRRHVEPAEGLTVDAARQMAIDAQLDDDVVDSSAEILVKIYEAFSSNDATLIEINPLIVTASREVVALDAKVTIDNSALFRHPELAENAADTDDLDEQEKMASERGLTYVSLDGDIGILGNGAGLCMSTLDVVANAGGNPANFLDAGGGSKADAIVDALEVISSNPNVKAILFNIFGGITRCDEVAKGIIEAYERVQMSVPLVVRLDGTNSEEGLRLLDEANLSGLHQEKTMLGAADRVVALAGGAS
jgi:succinyl-CoA synthetase beta subunit